MDSSEITSKNKSWKDNTKKYLFALYLIETKYKNGELKKKEKKKIEEELSSIFKKNYWNLNPNLKNPIISKIIDSRLNTFYI